MDTFMVERLEGLDERQLELMDETEPTSDGSESLVGSIIIDPLEMARKGVLFSAENNGMDEDEARELISGWYRLRK